MLLESYVLLDELPGPGLLDALYRAMTSRNRQRGAARRHQAAASPTGGRRSFGDGGDEPRSSNSSGSGGAWRWKVGPAASNIKAEYVPSILFYLAKLKRRHELRQLQQAQQAQQAQQPATGLQEPVWEVPPLEWLQLVLGAMQRNLHLLAELPTQLSPLLVLLCEVSGHKVPKLVAAYFAPLPSPSSPSSSSSSSPSASISRPSSPSASPPSQAGGDTHQPTTKPGREQLGSAPDFLVSFFQEYYDAMQQHLAEHVQQLPADPLGDVNLQAQQLQQSQQQPQQGLERSQQGLQHVKLQLLARLHERLWRQLRALSAGLTDICRVRRVLPWDCRPRSTALTHEWLWAVMETAQKLRCVDEELRAVAAGLEGAAGLSGLLVGREGFGQGQTQAQWQGQGQAQQQGQGQGQAQGQLQEQGPGWAVTSHDAAAPVIPPLPLPHAFLELPIHVAFGKLLAGSVWVKAYCDVTCTAFTAPITARGTGQQGARRTAALGSAPPLFTPASEYPPEYPPAAPLATNLVYSPEDSSALTAASALPEEQQVSLLTLSRLVDAFRTMEVSKGFGKAEAVGCVESMERQWLKLKGALALAGHSHSVLLQPPGAIYLQRSVALRFHGVPCAPPATSPPPPTHTDNLHHPIPLLCLTGQALVYCALFCAPVAPTHPHPSPAHPCIPVSPSQSKPTAAWCISLSPTPAPSPLIPTPLHPFHPPRSPNPLPPAASLCALHGCSPCAP